VIEREGECRHSVIKARDDLADLLRDVSVVVGVNVVVVRVCTCIACLYVYIVYVPCIYMYTRSVGGSWRA